MKKLSTLLTDAARLASMLSFETQQTILTHVKDAIEENNPQILFNVLASIDAALDDDLMPVLFERGDEFFKDGKPVIKCEVLYTATSPSRLYVETYDGYDGTKGSFTLEEVYERDDASRREQLKTDLEILGDFVTKNRIRDITEAEKMWCFFTYRFLADDEPLRTSLDDAEKTLKSLWERREL